MHPCTLKLRLPAADKRRHIPDLLLCCDYQCVLFSRQLFCRALHARCAPFKPQLWINRAPLLGVSQRDKLHRLWAQGVERHSLDAKPGFQARNPRLINITKEEGGTLELDIHQTRLGRK